MDKPNNVDFSKFNNGWYDPGKNGLVRIIWYAINAIVFQTYLFPFYKLKAYILRFFGAKIGSGFVIKPSVSIKYPWHLIIGNNVWIGENVWIDNLAEVRIGNNVCISQGAMLLSGNHDYKKTSFDLIVKKIILEDGCWIGAKSIVCPGITCKSHSILSVGSVANTDLEEYRIYQGVPAIQVRKRVIEV